MQRRGFLAALTGLVALKQWPTSEPLTPTGPYIPTWERVPDIRVTNHKAMAKLADAIHSHVYPNNNELLKAWRKTQAQFLAGFKAYD